MTLDASLPKVPFSREAPFATSDRAPTIRLARAGVAAATGGFGPRGTGGIAASWVQGRSALPDELFINSIVGPYYVSSNEVF